MTDKRRSLRDELKKLIDSANHETSNVASAINVGKGDHRSSISSRQRIVQRDGKTETVTETREERRTDG